MRYAWRDTQPRSATRLTPFGDKHRAVNMPLRPAGKRMNSMLWILSEVYYPEETGTGYYITRIAEHLALKRPVSVLCAQPAYSRAGVKARAPKLTTWLRFQVFVACSPPAVNSDTTDADGIDHALDVSCRTLSHQARRFNSGCNESAFLAHTCSAPFLYLARPLLTRSS